MSCDIMLSENCGNVSRRVEMENRSRELEISFGFEIITASFVLAASAFAGEDVVLYDSAGNALKPAQIDKVNIGKTCGSCHDVDHYAKAVHFNRKSKTVDVESTDCLACHLPKKNPFTAQGTIGKVQRVPDDSRCVSCHSDLSDWSVQRSHIPHAGLSCYDCHQDAGHKSTGAASCRGCHYAHVRGAPMPIHAGIPPLHFRRLACETCHIRQTPQGGVPGYILKDRIVTPVSEDDQLVHHNVGNPSQNRGAHGCKDCHSASSKFFFGRTLTGGTDSRGNPIAIPTYKSLRMTKMDVMLGALRERVIKPYSLWLFVFIVVASALHYVIFGPKRVHYSPDEPEIPRFGRRERFAHITGLACFIVLATIGVLMLLHVENPYQIIRRIHAWTGPFFVMAVVGMIYTWWANALFVPCDKEWVKNLGGYLWMRGTCPAEKFNAGQKMYFWLVVVGLGGTVCVTGSLLIIGRGSAPALIYTLHDLAATALIAGVLGHIYLGVFANPGTVIGAITGRVKESWARRHHPDWYRHLGGE